MRMTTFTDYTLRVLMYLALDPDRLATIPEVATAYGISENHLMKVVHQLARNGFVDSMRGKGGGIRLAGPASRIRLGAVVRSSEGEAPIVECMGSDKMACCIAPACQLSGILESAFAAFYDKLDEYTLADLMGQGGSMVKLLNPVKTRRSTRTSPTS